MFRSPPAAPLPLKVVEVAAEQPVPLSVLSLDLVAPATGWPAYLNSRGIEVVTDDIGRQAIGRADARQLFDEKRETEARRAQHFEAVERQAFADYQQQRARLFHGVSADELPVGVRAGDAMLQAARASLPKRQSPLEEAFSGESMTFHPIVSDEE
jgi:hypothetical protein